MMQNGICFLRYVLFYPTTPPSLPPVVDGSDLESAFPNQ